MNLVSLIIVLHKKFKDVPKVAADDLCLSEKYVCWISFYGHVKGNFFCLVMNATNFMFCR